jgi:hypothetical protein
MAAKKAQKAQKGRIPFLGSCPAFRFALLARFCG